MSRLITIVADYWSFAFAKTSSASAKASSASTFAKSFSVFWIKAPLIIILWTHLLLSQHSPPESYTYLKCTLSSNQMRDNPFLRARLTCKSYKINSSTYFGIFVAMDNQGDDGPIFYIFHSTLLLVMDLVL